MKIKLLEAHDRLQHLIKDQSDSISQGCEDCLKKNPLSLRLQSKSPYIYIYAHPRTHIDGVTKVIYWQPRLGKPKSQTNSYLFRAISNSDSLEICWMLPPREMWDQYKKGNVTEHETVRWSIDQFLHNREELDRPFEDDLPKDRIDYIYREIASEMDYEKGMDKMMGRVYEPKQEILEESSSFFSTDS